MESVLFLAGIQIYVFPCSHANISFLQNKKKTKNKKSVILRMTLPGAFSYMKFALLGLGYPGSK
jgi:hypothetical protein